MCADVYESGRALFTCVGLYMYAALYRCLGFVLKMCRVCGGNGAGSRDGEGPGVPSHPWAAQGKGWGLKGIYVKI